MTSFTPFGVDPDDAGFSGLYDGVPDWLASSYWDWTKRQFRLERYSRGFVTVAFDRDLALRFERTCRVQIGSLPGNVADATALLRKAVEASGQELRLGDFLLAYGSQADAEGLESLLMEGGSKWRVGVRDGRPGLISRVPEGVQLSAESVMSAGGRAGERLAEAWTHAFGIAPDFSRAYSLAVKAVEDAAVPVVSPNDRSATLGKLIGQIRASGDWFLEMPRTTDRAKPSAVLVDSMEMLWVGQADRHGGVHDSSLAISQEAAETAVTVAAFLVHAFERGHVVRGDQT